MLLLGGPRHPTLEVEIYRLTAQLLDLKAAAAVALLQAAMLAIFVASAAKAQQRAVRPHRVIERHGAAGARWPVPMVLVPVALFMAAPLVALVRRSGNWSAVWSQRSGLALMSSLRIGTASALLATIVGGLAAVAVSGTWRGRRLLDLAVVLPLGTSAVTIGFGLLIAYQGSPVDLRGTTTIVVIAHALVGLPFVTRMGATALRDIPHRQRDAAAMLGATPVAVWRYIDWPALRRPLALGAGFAFAVSLGEFGASAFLVRRGNPTLPTLIGELLGRPGIANNQQAHALALVLAMITAGVMVLVDRAGRS